MNYKFQALAVLGLLLFLNAPGAFGQGVSYPDTAPPRGVAPVGAYDFDKLETINESTGNLMYTIPLTSMPLGRAGMTLPIALRYNSAQFDYQYSNTYGSQPPNPAFLFQTLTTDVFGGWSIDPGYHLYTETKPSGVCSVSNGTIRTSLVMPDGSRHQLYFSGFPQGFTGDGDGYFPWSYGGQSNCTQYTSLTGPIHLFTIDGSYISVVVSTAGVWTATLPDGTTITSGNPETITDRNGNKITIAYTTANNNYYTTLTDDLNRTVQIAENLNTGGWTMTQTGYGGGSPPLTWTFGTTTAGTSYSFQYVCQNYQSSGGQSVSYQTCSTAIQGGGASTLQVPSNNPLVPLTYTFQYGSQSGLLQTVTLPSGASTTYSYQCNVYASCFTNRTDLLNPVASKTLTWTDQADNGSTQKTETWTYSYTTSGQGTYAKTSPDNGTETTYLTYINNVAGQTFPSRVVKPNGDSIDRFYQSNRPYGAAYGSPNPYVAAQIINLAVNGSSSVSSVTLFKTDKNGNKLGASVYDWSAYSTTGRNSNGVLTSSPAASGTLLSQTQNAFTVTTAAQAGSGTETISDDSNAYWNAAAPRFLHLLAGSTISGTGTGSVTGYTYDGNANPLSLSRWDSTKVSSQPAVSALNSSNSSVTNWTWDGYGNLLQETDPNGNATHYTYDSNSLYLAKKVQAYGTAVARTFTYSWDNYLGVLTTKTDADNGSATNYGYDAMGRQTSVTEGSGSQFRSTQATYNDAARQVTVKKDQTAFQDGLLTSITSYDQLYRVALTQQMESTADASGIKVQTRYQYNGNNSYKLVSNPFRAATSSAASSEPTMGWTLSTYDQNGRAVKSQSFSGSGLPAPWGSNSSSTGAAATAYSTPIAQSTRTTDQAGSQRDSSMDGLGRISSVIEYPGSGSYSTGYSYDVLGDLTKVTQSSQSRVFAYDSLKRLSASTNPENYTVASSPALGCAGGVYANCYYYDADGNLTSKTDNRGVGVAYSYDALNRVLGKTYFNLPKTVNYQAISYSYDNSAVNNSRGRLTSVSTLTGDTSTTSYLQYDAFGQVLSSSQTTYGNTYTFAYSYNLAGSLATETYPSGRVVNTCYDGANRVSQVGIPDCGNTTGAYVSNFTYAAHGAPTQYVFANNVWREPSYNSRLQMSGFLDEVYSPTAKSYAILISAALNWGATNNNGNLQSTSFNNGGPGYQSFLTFNQNFTYDGVNRLTAASDTGGWSRNFSYDAYGNMTPSGNPAPPSVSFNSNNQISTQTYDQAGNQLSVNGNTVGYDYESHVVSETDGQTHAVETYVFDGNGNRVEKYNSTNRTVFVYDALGRMAAEYAQAQDAPTCITCYLSVDHLGTPRLVTDQDGNVVARHDYLPFGEEVAANAFGRDGHWGSTGNDTINQKFTGKERDSESGLDYFGARYYGSALGRFTSPDEPLEDQSPVDPQSWNLYAYVRNNPLTNTDPNGEDCVTTSDQTDKSVTVTVAAGTCNGNSGTYVNGTVDKSSLTYNGTSVGYSYASYDSNVSLGAGTINLGSSQGGDINPFGLAVIQSLGRQTNSMYGLMGTFAGGSLLGGAAVAGGLAATSSGAALTTIGAITPAAVNVADLSNKIVRQMASRGWTAQDILDTVQNGEAYAAVNKATGGAATEYVNAATGKFVVVDNATKQVLQVSRQGMSPNHLLP